MNTSSKRSIELAKSSEQGRSPLKAVLQQHLQGPKVLSKDIRIRQQPGKDSTKSLRSMAHSFKARSIRNDVGAAIAAMNYDHAKHELEGIEIHKSYANSFAGGAALDSGSPGRDSMGSGLR